MESRVALCKLVDEIRILKERVRKDEHDWFVLMRKAWHPGHPGSRLSLFKLSSASFCLVLCLGLLAEGSAACVTAGVAVLLVACSNLVITGLDAYLRREEIFRRVDR